MWSHRRRLTTQKRLFIESLESRRVFAGLPFGSTEWDTAEFMLGRVAVTPVFLESNGQFDANTETWTNAHKSEVLQNIEDGLQFWVDLLATKSSVHQLEWVIDESWVNSPAQTIYEPITRPSNDYIKWVPEFLTNQGYATSNGLETNLRAFNQAQREKLDTDWSFTIFVVNSQNDSDGSFAPGSFSRAFAFAGGLFEVVPSTRPASTFAHETGHIFYARDEYSGGSDYFQRRGYYDTQNTNAIDRNPDPNFQQQDSIMSSGGVLDRAYDNLVSPASTLAQVGWQDSDNDGIFDVLDVPLALVGSGRFDITSQTYKFSGQAFAQTLANKNSGGLGNSITLNKVTKVQYRFSGDTQWQTLLEPNQYTVDLQLTIPISLANIGRSIEIRAIDDRIGIVSDSFVAQVSSQPKISSEPGMAGYVWNDTDGDGTMDADEAGRANWDVQLRSSNGTALDLYKIVALASVPNGYISPNQFAGVALKDIGTDAHQDMEVGNGSQLSGKTLKPYSGANSRLLDAWNSAHVLELSLAASSSKLTIETHALSALSRVRLRYYDSNGGLLGSQTYEFTPDDGTQHLSVHDQQSRIRKVTVEPLLGSVVELGSFEFGTPTTVASDTSGVYRFDVMPTGNYQVQLVLPRDIYDYTIANNGVIQTNYQNGDEKTGLHLGAQLSPTAWINVNDPLDVNDDGHYTSLDLLQIFNNLNAHGRGLLETLDIPKTRFVDANQDRALSSLDALAIINKINSIRRSGSEGEESSPMASDADFSSSYGVDFVTLKPQQIVVEVLHSKVLFDADADDESSVASESSGESGSVELATQIPLVDSVSTKKRHEHFDDHDILSVDYSLSVMDDFDDLACC